MIITCPNCSTQFTIPDEAYRPGKKARCSQCHFVFPLPERDGDAAEAAAPVSSVASFDPLSNAMPDPHQDSATADETDTPPRSPASIDDVVFEPTEEKKPPRKKRSKLFMGVAAALLVCIIAVGGLWVGKAFFGSSGSTSPRVIGDSSLKTVFGGKELSPEEKAREEARQTAVRNLALVDVRQYTVIENMQTGRMVVVEGQVVNNFDKPKDLILLEVTLFDNKGNPLVIREQYCGVTLSLLQLRTLPKPAIESALNNQTVILSNNTDIPPGGRVPFVTVFFNLPAQAYEFEVKIADVKEATSAPAPSTPS